MKFYGREKELEILNNHWQYKGLTVDVLIGRRRIGKTFLVSKYAQDKKHLYFYTSRKEITALLEEWAEVLREEFPEVAVFKNINQFLQTLFLLIKNKSEKYLVMFDEFQNFKYIDPGAFSDFQKHIDLNTFPELDIHILFLGSSITLMEKIFKGSKEPLFNRATWVLRLDGFSFKLIDKILNDQQLGNKTIDFSFDIYSLFNGVPKYYDLLIRRKNEIYTVKNIIKEYLLNKDGVLANEGFFLLESEFGSEYQLYFDILTYLASGEKRVSDIANRLKEPSNKIAVYLHRLEKYYRLIERRLPLLHPVKFETRYYLKDVFLRFWFRYIYRNLTYIEKGSVSLLWNIVEKDFRNFQGLIFEDLCVELFFDDKAQKHLSLNFEIREYGRYWNGKTGFEVDIIAYDKEQQNLLLLECKINPKRITKKFLRDFKTKAQYPAFGQFTNKILAVWTLTKPDVEVKKICQQADVRCLSLEEVV